MGWTSFTVSLSFAICSSEMAASTSAKRSIYTTYHHSSSQCNAVAQEVSPMHENG
eukprot:m.163788 g.163788  ORF g.163788 m.163788 type:complete len:55 (-) comp14392_c0_seq34:1606-1770(-)